MLGQRYHFYLQWQRRAIQDATNHKAGSLHFYMPKTLESEITSTLPVNASSPELCK